MVRRPRADDGFSLLEAIVSLAILGVLLVLAFSGRSLIDNRRLAGTAREIVSDIRFVQQRATTERRCWRVEFDPSPPPAGQRYRIEFLEGGAWTPGAGCTGGVWRPHGPSEGKTLPPRVDLKEATFTGGRMVVSPFGNPNAGSITLRTPAGQERVITVNVMGRVSLGP